MQKKCGHYLTSHVKDGQVYKTLRCDLCGATVYGCNGGHDIFDMPDQCPLCEEIFGTCTTS